MSFQRQHTDHLMNLHNVLLSRDIENAMDSSGFLSLISLLLKCDRVKHYDVIQVQKANYQASPSVLSYTVLFL